MSSYETPATPAVPVGPLPASPGTSRRAAPARARAPWRAVAVPDEHGGWSLSAEPALLGLLVAPSSAGAALAAAAMVAFVARTPVTLVLVDLRRRRWLRRTTLATRIAAAELVLLAALATVA
ncbi:MAG TPA: YwiC-like family protein, partial [Acidimicrobiales bacterium]|nr:YwiC-like family protein [Acidimicrobiales bacterium]